MGGFGLALFVVAAGVALFFYGGTSQASDPMALPLVVVGGATVLAGLVLIVLAWRAWRRRLYAAAIAATDAVARWQIHQTDMDAFDAVDRARAGRLWSLANALKLADSVPPEGLPVVIGEKSILIGEDLYEHGMIHWGEPGEVSWHEGNPGFIEISCLLKTTKAPLIHVLRIPVPASARVEGARAFAHLHAQIGARERQNIYARFPDHFEAVAQVADTPHRLQARRKYVFAGLGLFFALLLAIIFFAR
jgi:hypothetical protein